MEVENSMHSLYRINWPMLLTMSRFMMIPVFGWLFTVNRYYAIAIILLAGITDLLDGYLARRLEMTSEWGKMLDPLADKLMMLTVLFYLGINNYISISIFYLVLLKESAMVIGSGILVSQGKFIGADWLGKATTMAFFAAVLLIPFGLKVGYLCLYAALGLMIVAFVSYVMKFIRSVGLVFLR
jgi:cardiolipin synthase